ncbi:MAG: M48 family metalloprotease [Candidatus Dormibacteria bacterium]|jgi:hypothetical protein
MATSPAAPPRPAPETPHPSGRPAGQAGAVAWIAVAVRRRWAPGLVALVCAWSGVWLAVWLVVADAIAGAVLSALGSAIGAALAGAGSSTGPGSGALTVAGGALRAAAGGLVSGVAALVGEEPLAFLGALAGGLAVSMALLAASVALEPRLLRWSGCRRLSRREAARVTPLLQAAAADLGLSSLPLLLMAGGDDLRVRVHSRHLVVGRSLLDELGAGPAGDATLEAVLCHALHHWAAGDGVGLRWVRCCGLPLVILYDAGCWMAQQGNALIALAGWIALWPAWLLVRLVIEPVVALGSRRQEYAADAAVRATGRGEALHRALSLLGELEPGRSGWDRVIAATHPPRELRLEALEPDPEEWSQSG